MESTLNTAKNMTHQDVKKYTSAGVITPPILFAVVAEKRLKESEREPLKELKANGVVSPKSSSSSP